MLGQFCGLTDSILIVCSYIELLAKSRNLGYHLLCLLLWKRPSRSHLKKAGFTVAHGLRVWAIVGKAWWQMHEAAGHMTFAVRKQGEMNDGAQPASLFLFPFSVEPQPLECRHSHLGWIVWPHLIQSRHLLTDAPRI